MWSSWKSEPSIRFELVFTALLRPTKPTSTAGAGARWSRERLRGHVGSLSTHCTHEEQTLVSSVIQRNWERAQCTCSWLCGGCCKPATKLQMNVGASPFCRSPLQQFRRILSASFPRSGGCLVSDLHPRIPWRWRYNGTIVTVWK